MSFPMTTQRKEKRSGGLNFKKFFKSMTKSPHGSGGAYGGGGSGGGGGGGDRYSPRAVLPSGDNQFAIAHGDSTLIFRGTASNGAAPPFMQRSPPKANGISSASRVGDNSGGGAGGGGGEFTSPGIASGKPAADANVVRWGLVLSRIPKLVAESTSVSSSSPAGSAANSPTASGVGSTATTESGGTASGGPSDMSALLESLRQMASREYQAQILQYYTGHAATAAVASPGMNNINILSNWEQRKVFKQCRRSLLLCWKFIIAQLNDEKAHKALSSETRDTYYQLLGLIAERVEFNLLGDPASGAASSSASSSSSSTNGRPPTASKARSSSHAGGATGYVSSASPSASSTASTMHSFDHSDNNTSSNSGSGNEESGNEGERDIYLYRCLLVATFKLVIESIDAASQKKRPFISFAESQFFAKVLAICFFRIPVVQRMILDAVFEAYRYKKWTKTNAGTTAPQTNSGGRTGTPSHAYLQSRLNRRRSSSKPWNSMTFEGTLARWSEFEGQMLSEWNEDNQSGMDNDVEGKSEYSDKLSESSSSESGDNNHPGNPFAPPSRSITDRYKRMNPTLFRWSRYSPYLGPYADSDVFRTNESTQPAWLHKLIHDGEFFGSFMSSYVQHAEFVSIGEPVWYCLPGYPLLMRVTMLLVKEAAWQKWLAVRETTENKVVAGSKSNQEDHQLVAFEVKSPRGIKTILDAVVQFLKNRDALESVVLAMFECTNVLNSKSVSVCLSRLEEWFAAAAERVGENAAGDISYRLPANFQGLAIGTAVRIMLCSESFEILNRVLLFLYNRMDYFDGELRQSVLKAIVQRHMYLFLHWNADVRHTYHHVLVYKIIRTNRYLLDSPIDQLLVGRIAMLQHDSHARDESTAGVGFDEGDGGFDGVDTRPVLSAAEFNVLRLEQALWRAFDACLASICVQERRNARDANRKYQVELLAARSRAVAFQKLNVKSAGDDSDRTSSVNEGLPGHKASQEFDLLNDELNRDPPYYLRYLPAEEVSSLDELRRLAQTVKYPAELQVYAASSLRGYSDLLKQYFHDLRARGHAEAPPLGFM